jgi:hypothetical protein
MNQKVLESREFNFISKLYSNWDIAQMELDELSRAEQSNALSNMLIGLIQPYTSKLPLLYVPTYPIHSLLHMGHPFSKLFLDIQIRLCKVHSARLFLYHYNQSKDPVTVFIWEKDYPKLSKRMREKLIRIHVEFTKSERELGLHNQKITSYERYLDWKK